MFDRVVLRVGAVAAMVGAPLAIVFNLLHPRTDEFTAAAEVQLASTEDIWRFDHYMLVWTIALAFIALVAIGRSFGSEPAASWGRVALYSAIGSVIVAFIALGVDGFGVVEAAEGAGGSIAESVAHVGGAMFLGVIGSLFGLTPILYGVAVLSGDEYAGWLGWVAILAGAIGIVTGSIIYFNGFTEFTVNVLFPIGSILFTLWIGIMGIMLWRRASTAPAA